MIRGRLIKVNGKAVGPENYSDDRAQRLVDREFNLSYAKDAPGHNRITAGAWFRDGSDELSIEEGIAKTLGIKLGDALTFDIAGQSVTARATSLRKVNWDSMRANFFVMMPPSLLADQPASFITAFHLPESKSALTGDLLREFPNLTVVDTSAVFRQVQAVHRPGDRGGRVPVRLHARGGRAGAVRRAGVQPRRTRARSGPAARAGRIAPAAVARAARRARLHRCAGRAARGDRRQRDRLGAGEVCVRVRLHRLAVGVRRRASAAARCAHWPAATSDCAAC